uniref:Uncharacterized protein n=1 Tax=Rhizophora mucronata TaxID=61149 RepID=A0A2P2K866_RHIMU
MWQNKLLIFYEFYFTYFIYDLTKIDLNKNL